MQKLEKAFEIFQSLPAPTKNPNVLSILDSKGKLYAILQYPGERDYVEELYDVKKDKVIFQNPLKKSDVHTKFSDLVTHGSPKTVYVDRDTAQGMSSLVSSANL